MSKKFKVTYDVSAIVSFLLGLAFLLFPATSGKVICNLLGACVLAFAAVNLLNYIQNKKRGAVVKSSLIIAAIAALFAIICFSKPYVILSFLPFIFGIILASAGAVKLPTIVHGLKNGRSPSPLFVASAIVPFVLGVILLFNPFGVTKSVIMFFGVGLIINGIMEFSSSLCSK